MVNIFVDQFILCEQKLDYAIHLTSLGWRHLAGLTSSVTQSSHTGWPGHKFLARQVMQPITSRPTASLASQSLPQVSSDLMHLG